MKRTNIYIHILIVLLLLCYTSLVYAEDDFEWEQTGSIRYSIGYNWIGGNQDKFISAYNLFPGWNYTNYSINLSGNLYKNENDIEYYFAKDPGLAADILLYWDNPVFSARYDKEIRLEFDELKLAFNKNQIDGLEFHTDNAGLTLFRGQESYIPLSKSIFVTNPARNEYSLLDIPSAGDIVEHSEVIIVDGEVLTGGRDYSLNYLTGKLSMYIPLEWGTNIEAKFLFIITNEELAPKGELLQGIVLSKKWLENNIGAFYFKRGDNVNQVAGVTGQYSLGSLRVKGEWATSKTSEGEQANAYKLDSHYNDDLIDINYQICNIHPDFQEVGVVPFTKGKSSVFDMKYQAEANLLFQLQLNKYEFDDGWSTYINTQKKAMVDYKFTSAQSAQIIFDSRDRNLYGESQTSKDFSLGYTIKTKPISMTIGQSMQDSKNRFAKIWVDYAPFRINGSYNVENLWDGQEHRGKAEISYRPSNRLNMLTFAEYRRRFDAEKPTLRIYLNGNWSPTQSWSYNAGYLFFNNPKYESNNQRFNTMINYSTSRLNTNLNVAKLKNESKTVIVDDLDIGWSTNMIFLKNYHFNYQVLMKNFREYMKFYEMVNQERKDRNHTCGLSYVWHDYYVFSTNIGYINNSLGIQGIWNSAVTKTIGVGCSYQKDLQHQFSVDLGMEKKNGDTTLSFDSRILHPIGRIKLDCVGKINYLPEKKALTKSMFTYTIILPKVWKITPSLGYKSDFTNDAQQQRLRKLEAKLEYQWKEKQLIFIEAKLEEYLNWKNHQDDYRSLGIFTGIQIDY